MVDWLGPLTPDNFEEKLGPWQAGKRGFTTENLFRS